MSYSFVAASSQGMKYNFGTNRTPPFTIMCWVKPTTLAGCALCWSGTAQNGYSLNITAAGNVNAIHQNGAGSATATSAVADNMSAGVWTHIAGVFTSSTSRQSFCNGNAGTVNTGSQTANAGTELDIAFKYNSSSAKTSFFDGLIAECYWVKVALPAHFIKGIANGGFTDRRSSQEHFPFRLINPAAPLTMWDQQSNAGFDLTLVATPTFSKLHPPVAMPRMGSRLLAS